MGNLGNLGVFFASFFLVVSVSFLLVVLSCGGVLSMLKLIYQNKEKIR